MDMNPALSIAPHVVEKTKSTTDSVLQFFKLGQDDFPYELGHF